MGHAPFSGAIFVDKLLGHAYKIVKEVQEHLSAITIVSENLPGIEAAGGVLTVLNDHIGNTSNPHGVTKAQVGLGNVDNTSDLNKPVSSATQTALDAKLAASTFTAHLLATNPHGVTKTDVGLSNVDNTSDANKPISLAMAAALAYKAPLHSPDFTGTPRTTVPGTSDNSTRIPTTSWVRSLLSSLPNGGGGGSVSSIDDVPGLRDALFWKAELFHVHGMADFREITDQYIESSPALLNNNANWVFSDAGMSCVAYELIFDNVPDQASADIVGLTEKLEAARLAHYAEFPNVQLEFRFLMEGGGLPAESIGMRFNNQYAPFVPAAGVSGAYEVRFDAHDLSPITGPTGLKISTIDGSLVFNGKVTVLTVAKVARTIEERFVKAETRLTDLEDTVFIKLQAPILTPSDAKVMEKKPDGTLIADIMGVLSSTTLSITTVPANVARLSGNRIVTNGVLLSSEIGDNFVVAITQTDNGARPKTRTDNFEIVLEEQPVVELAPLELISGGNSLTFSEDTAEGTIIGGVRPIEALATMSLTSSDGSRYTVGADGSLRIGSVTPNASTHPSGTITVRKSHPNAPAPGYVEATFTINVAAAGSGIYLSRPDSYEVWDYTDKANPVLAGVGYFSTDEGEYRAEDDADHDEIGMWRRYACPSYPTSKGHQCRAILFASAGQGNPLYEIGFFWTPDPASWPSSPLGSMAGRNSHPFPHKIVIKNAQGLVMSDPVLGDAVQWHHPEWAEPKPLNDRSVWAYDGEGITEAYGSANRWKQVIREPVSWFQGIYWSNRKPDLTTAGYVASQLPNQEVAKPYAGKMPYACNAWFQNRISDPKLSNGGGHIYYMRKHQVTIDNQASQPAPADEHLLDFWTNGTYRPNHMVSGYGYAPGHFSGKRTLYGPGGVRYDDKVINVALFHAFKEPNAPHPATTEPWIDVAWEVQKSYLSEVVFWQRVAEHDVVPYPTNPIDFTTTVIRHPNEDWSSAAPTTPWNVDYRGAYYGLNGDLDHNIDQRSIKNGGPYYANQSMYGLRAPDDLTTPEKRAFWGTYSKDEHHNHTFPHSGLSRYKSALMRWMIDFFYRDAQLCFWAGGNGTVFAQNVSPMAARKHGWLLAQTVAAWRYTNTGSIFTREILEDYLIDEFSRWYDNWWVKVNNPVLSLSTTNDKLAWGLQRFGNVAMQYSNLTILGLEQMYCLEAFVLLYRTGLMDRLRERAADTNDLLQAKAIKCVDALDYLRDRFTLMCKGLWIDDPLYFPEWNEYSWYVTTVSEFSAANNDPNSAALPKSWSDLKQPQFNRPRMVSPLKNNNNSPADNKTYFDTLASAFKIQLPSALKYVLRLNDADIDQAEQAMITEWNKVKTEHDNMPRIQRVNAQTGLGWLMPNYFPYQLPAGEPTPPSGLYVTGTAPGSISLAWTDNATTETGYTIERSLSPSFTNPAVTSVGANVTAATINGLLEDATYYFRVRGTNGNYWSNVANATTPVTSAAPAQPGVLTFTPASYSMGVSWPAYTDTAVGLQLEWSLASDYSGATIVQLPTSATSHTIENLQPSTPIYVRLKAYRNSQESTYRTGNSATLAPPAIYTDAFTGDGGLNGRTQGGKQWYVTPNGAAQANALTAGGRARPGSSDQAQCVVPNHQFAAANGFYAKATLKAGGTLTNFLPQNQTGPLVLAKKNSRVGVFVRPWQSGSDNAWELFYRTAAGNGRVAWMNRDSAGGTINGSHALRPTDGHVIEIRVKRESATQVRIWVLINGTFIGSSQTAATAGVLLDSGVTTAMADLVNANPSTESFDGVDNIGISMSLPSAGAPDYAELDDFEFGPLP